MLSVISAGRVRCQLRWLHTVESSRERHLEQGRRGNVAVRVRITEAMALSADLRWKCVFVPVSRCLGGSRGEVLMTT